MKIIDLLKNNGFPNAYIQGHHTTIRVDAVNGELFFCVDSKDSGGKHTISKYIGTNEEDAVMAFINNENN